MVSTLKKDILQKKITNRKKIPDFYHENDFRKFCRKTISFESNFEISVIHLFSYELPAGNFVESSKQKSKAVICFGI